MKQVLRLVGVIAIVVVTFAAGVSVWLYFYTADLPSISQLNEFNPVSEVETRLHSCDGSEHTVIALPRQRLGSYMSAALIAAEGKPDGRSPYVALFSPAAEGQYVVSYQLQLARSLVCPNRSPLRRQLQELRLANAINRKFGQQELLTIYLNRIYLGPEMYGVEAGAQKYFGKPASQLTLEETAVTVGIIRSPRLYSPVSHPDRAAQRRNSILDEMVVQRSVLQADADRAKAAPIHALP
jgi:membrane carboxypeptidase/penicillin-binding protein